MSTPIPNRLKQKVNGMTELLPACHVDRYQLRCDACNHRLRTRSPSSFYEPMYPYFPWCGAPVSVEAQELERRKA